MYIEGLFKYNVIFDLIWCWCMDFCMNFDCSLLHTSNFAQVFNETIEIKSLNHEKILQHFNWKEKNLDLKFW